MKRIVRKTVYVLSLGMLMACSPANRSNGERVIESEGYSVSCTIPLVEYQSLLGSVHEHSGFSDGTVGTTPADYYAAGPANGLDFMVGTDHSDNASLPLTASQDCVSEQFVDCLQVSPEGVAKWDATAQMAEAASSEMFTAVRGFEWTSDRFGHINVLFSQNQINAKTGTGYAVSMEDFWTWLSLPVESAGGADGLVVLNHPGREDMLHAACDDAGPVDEGCGSVYNGDPAYAFEDFNYRAEFDEQVVGVEMYGKSGDYYDADNGAPPGGWYAYALDKGWHLGPIGAEDEHGTVWGQGQRAKTVLLAPDRNLDSLKAAFKARRFYALAHDYSPLKLEYVAHMGDSDLPLPMGSRLSASAGTNLVFSAAVVGLDSPRIEIIGPGGEVLESQDADELSFEVQLQESEEAWRFVRIIDLADSDADDKSGEVVAVSAPIWFAVEQPQADCFGSIDAELN